MRSKVIRCSSKQTKWIDAGPILSIREAIGRLISDKRAAALPAVSTRVPRPTRDSFLIGQSASYKKKSNANWPCVAPVVGSVQRGCCSLIGLRYMALQLDTD